MFVIAASHWSDQEVTSLAIYRYKCQQYLEVLFKKYQIFSLGGNGYHCYTQKLRTTCLYTCRVEKFTVLPIPVSTELEYPKKKTLEQQNIEQSATVKLQSNVWFTKC